MNEPGRRGAAPGVPEGPEAPGADGADGAPGGRSPQSVFVDRELSWLAFNHRVLQEAMDPEVPVFERLHFLSIFSSNLDEFFRVRVASLRSLLRLKKKRVRKLSVHPARLLRQIHTRVGHMQEEFGETFRGEILPELERQGIFLLSESSVTARQGEFLRRYFQEEVRPHVEPTVLDPYHPPFLSDRGIYLVVELWPEESIALSAEKPDFGIVEVPSPPLGRFVTLPADGERRLVMFLDDVIRYTLPALFPGYDVGGAYAVKLSRDAELYLEDEFSGDFLGALRKSLSKRETGLPSRFLYDLQASYAMITLLKEAWELDDEDLVLGGRYHNLHDLAHFPRFGIDELSYEPRPPLDHPELDGVPSILDAVAQGDRLLHFPYQSYRYTVRFLQEAAEDPDVEEIWLTVYRVSEDSPVLRALLEAAERGKKVRVFVEVQARFDEAANLRWAERMERAGIVTIYSIPGLKVHAKVALVVRREGDGRRRYAYMGTGNFNEQTARFYTDVALLTADPRITEEVEQVFLYLAGDLPDPTFEHLLVAPFDLRERLYGLIEAEAEAARAGGTGRIALKLNALEDQEIIERLYDANRAGVDMDMVVRGICCLVPGVEGQSERIRARSIVDRFLEHWRMYVFHAGGEERIYLASADWMHRNLSRRVEVAFPVYDPAIRAQLLDLLDLQLRDDVKARRLDGDLRNERVERSPGRPPLRAQEATREYMAGLLRRRGAPAGPPEAS